MESRHSGPARDGAAGDPRGGAGGRAGWGQGRACAPGLRPSRSATRPAARLPLVPDRAVAGRGRGRGEGRLLPSQDGRGTAPTLPGRLGRFGSERAELAPPRGRALCLVPHPRPTLRIRLLSLFEVPAQIRLAEGGPARPLRRKRPCISLLFPAVAGSRAASRAPSGLTPPGRLVRGRGRFPGLSAPWGVAVWTLFHGTLKHNQFLLGHCPVTWPRAASPPTPTRVHACLAGECGRCGRSQAGLRALHLWSLKELR